MTYLLNVTLFNIDITKLHLYNEIKHVANFAHTFGDQKPCIMKVFKVQRNN